MITDTDLPQPGACSPSGEGMGALHYLTPEGTMMAVAIGVDGGRLSAGVPTRLFDIGLRADTNRDHDAVSRDGKRFLIAAPAAGLVSSSPRFVVVENFFEELKRPLPEN